MTTPEQLESHLSRALALMDSGRYDEALAEFEAALRVNPGSAMAYNKIGVIYAEKRELARAEQAFRKAIDCDQKYAPAYSNLGNIFLERGELDRAIAAYEEAIALDPRHAPAYHNLAVAYRRKGNIGKSVELLKTERRLNLENATEVDKQRISSLGRFFWAAIGIIVIAIIILALSR